MSTLIAPPLTVLRLPQVLARTGLCKSAVYAGMAQGLFPKNIPISTRARGWSSEEIDSWITERIAASHNQPKSPGVN